MKSVILAAGYATRLYPITKDFPKPLLEVQGKSILSRIILDLDKIPEITEHVIISNHRFVSYFEYWYKSISHALRCPVTIIDDGSTENDNRLGAVKDISFAIEKCNITEDIIVMAGDNILNFSISGFVDFYNNKKTTCIMRHYEGSVEKLRKTGVVTIDENDKVTEMEEKPQEPKSNWACPPFYIYPASDLNLISQAVKNGECNVDAPGDFIAWFCKKSDVHAYLMPGKRFDIGNLESLKQAEQSGEL